MTKMLFISLALFSSSVFANTSDMEIEFPYYQTRFEKLVCTDTAEDNVTTPALFEEKDLRLEKVVVSITLDRALLLANYTENGIDCRYNAVFTVDKRKFHRTLTLLSSQAFDAEGRADSCAEFKSVLDQSLAFVPYKIDHDFVAVTFKSFAAPNECASSDVLGVFRRIRRQ